MTVASSTQWVVGITLGVVVIAVAAAILITIVALAARISKQASTAEEAGRLTRMIPGVIGVVNHIRCDYDDRAILATGLAYGLG